MKALWNLVIWSSISWQQNSPIPGQLLLAHSATSVSNPVRPQYVQLDLEPLGLELQYSIRTAEESSIGQISYSRHGSQPWRRRAHSMSSTQIMRLLFPCFQKQDVWLWMNLLIWGSAGPDNNPWKLSTLSGISLVCLAAAFGSFLYWISILTDSCRQFLDFQHNWSLIIVL